MITRDDIVNEARGWVGVRWKHQGRSRAGIDCAGLIVNVGNELKLTNYDTNDYSRLPDPTVFVDKFERNLDVGDINNILPGDVLVFRQLQFPCHTGIASIKHDVLHLIHAHAPRRQVIEEPLALWADNLRFCFKYRGVE